MFERTRAKILFDYYLKQKLGIKLQYKIVMQSYGADFIVRLKGQTDITVLNTHIAYLRALFNSDIEIVDKKSKAVISVIYPLQEQPFKIDESLSEYEVLLGYDTKGNKIISNQKIMPHIALQGISNSGKTYAIKQSLLQLNATRRADITIINAFREDYKDVKANYINDTTMIESYLNRLVNSPYRNRPLYVVIDEFLVLCRSKKISKLIEDLLAQGRHKNIFIIAISQSMLKSDFSGKSLFNTRVSFLQDKSTIVAFLNCDSTLVDQLKQREFYCNVSENGSVIKGRSFKC